MGVALVAAPAPAVADDKASDKQSCIAAAEQGQSQRDDGQYRTARDSFLKCASDGCPRVIVQSCTKWLRELDESAPTIVLGAKDEQGNDLTDVKVTFDGAPFATELTGKPMTADAGEHVVRFERDGSVPVQQKLLLRAGEKARVVSVTLKAVGTEEVDAGPEVEAAVETPEAPPEAVMSTHHVVAASMGLGAIAAAATGVVFVLQSNQKKQDAEGLRRLGAGRMHRRLQRALHVAERRGRRPAQRHERRGRALCRRGSPRRRFARHMALLAQGQRCAADDGRDRADPWGSFAPSERHISMRTPSFRLLWCVVSASALFASVALENGCGGIDCAETETCEGIDAGAPDQSIPANEAASPMEAANGEAQSTEAESDVQTDSDAAAGDAEDEEDATLEDADAGDATRDAGSDADASLDAAADAASDAADAGDAATDAKVDACPNAGGVENCTNGIDDNCDGLVDCADPQCAAGYACVATAPAGWFGPGSLYDGLSSGTTPPCVAPFPNNAFELNSTPTSPALTCACACGTVSGGCTTPAITIFSDNQCGATNNCGSAGGPTCTIADGTRCGSGGQSVGVTVLPQPTTTGSCPSSVTTQGVPASTWMRTGETCGGSRTYVAGGCGTSAVCAEKPPSGFQPTLCVWKNADADCTTITGYPLMYKYYSSTNDTRACAKGTCGCNTATGVSCTLASATAYKSTDCSDGGMAITDLNVVDGGSAAAHCTDFSIDSVVSMTATVNAAGSCTTNGAATQTGSVTPNSATAWTVCCSQ